MAVSSVVLAALLIFSLPSLWAPGPRANKKGNDAYRKGRYDQALEQYQRGIEALPGERILSYNSGTALLQQGKHDDALKSLMAGAGDPRREVRASALYNSGNALFAAGKLPEAGSAYREAILSDPRDLDAKFNYELAQYRLKKQQQEQEKDKDQKDDQKDKQNQNNQDQSQNQQNQENQKQQQEEQQNQNQENQQNQAQNQEQPNEQEEEGQEQQQEQPRPASLLFRQEAERLLDALKANEMEMIKARLRSSRKKNVDRDW
jgi:Ca-activated chloride channel homolog